MNKLTKLGLTALAGSLVATSVSAGTLSVSGAASLSYDTGSEATGNKFAMGDSVNFAGSGDLDNGMTIDVKIELDGGTYDDYSLALGMGDAGTLTFSGASVGAGGLNKYGDNVPTANEEVYDATDGNDHGVVGNMSSTKGFFYNGTFGNIGLSAGYTANTGTAKSDASDKSIVVTYDNLIDGLTIGAGTGEVNSTQDEDTVWIKYVMGSVTLGFQDSSIDKIGSTADEDSKTIGASMAVNDNLSVSVGQQEVDIGTGSEKSSGVSASYTMGSMTIKAYANKTDDQSGTNGEDAESKGMSVAFAF